MPRDLSLDLRRAIVAHLRGTAALTALVPAAKIYGEFATSDEFPFIRMGYAIVTGYEASCWDGSESDFTIDAFAAGPGTAAISEIAKRIVAAMETFNPATVGMPEYSWEGTQVIPDVIPENLHAVIRFRIVAVQEAA